MIRVLSLLAGVAAVAACTVNYISGSHNSVKVDKDKGVMIDTDDDDRTERRPVTPPE